MSQGLMRVTNHPRKPDFVILKFPPDLNGIIRSLGPAQQAFDLGGYVMAREHMETLKNWARYNAVTLLDESSQSGTAPKAFECGNLIDVTLNSKTFAEPCAAPLKAGSSPKFCGACGQPTNPARFDQAEPSIGARCPSCDQVTLGGAAFCPKCGATMPERHLHAQKRRPKGEPETLTGAVADFATRLASRTPAVSPLPVEEVRHG